MDITKNTKRSRRRSPSFPMEMVGVPTAATHNLNDSTKKEKYLMINWFIKRKDNTYDVAADDENSQNVFADVNLLATTVATKPKT